MNSVNSNIVSRRRLRAARTLARLTQALVRVSCQGRCPWSMWFRHRASRLLPSACVGTGSGAVSSLPECRVTRNRNRRAYRSEIAHRRDA